MTRVLSSMADDQFFVMFLKHSWSELAVEPCDFLFPFYTFVLHPNPLVVTELFHSLHMEFMFIEITVLYKMCKGTS